MKINLLNNLGEQLLSFCIFTSGGLWKFPGAGFSGFWIFSYSGHLLVERKKIIDLTFFQKGGHSYRFPSRDGDVPSVFQGGGRPLDFPGEKSPIPSPMSRHWIIHVLLMHIESLRVYKKLTYVDNQNNKNLRIFTLLKHVSIFNTSKMVTEIRILHKQNGREYVLFM